MTEQASAARLTAIAGPLMPTPPQTLSARLREVAAFFLMSAKDAAKDGGLEAATLYALYAEHIKDAAAELDRLATALKEAEWRLESLNNRLTIDEHGTVTLKDMRR